MSLLGPDKEWGEYRCMCREFGAVTEAAALAAGRWVGQGSCARPRRRLRWKPCRPRSRGIPISGTVVVGKEQDPQVSPLAVGREVGWEAGPTDIVLRAWRAPTSWPEARQAPSPCWQRRAGETS